jgi:nucleotide-binding universal stress UspA family protein
MLRTILVPLDCTPFGEYALPMALSLARCSHARVHLVHVHALPEATYGELTVYDDRRLDEEIRRTEKQYLEKLRQDIEQKTGVTAVLHNVIGDMASGIRGVAETTAADLVVMTTHGRGPIGRFWLGSVADDLVRELKVPLLLVHPQKGAVNLSAQACLEHILIPLDGTPLGERIVEPVATLAKLTGADVTLLRVVTPVYPTILPAEAGTFGGMAVELMERIDQLQAQVKKDSGAYLEQIAKCLRERGLNVRTRVAVEDQPGSAIIEEAHKPIDLIAMETHGRHGLSRLLMGSVADKVIRGATIPVLVHCSHVADKE